MIQLEKRLPKWRQQFVKNGFKKHDFLVKNLKISCHLDHTILFKFHQHEVQTFLKECMERLKTFDVSISNGSRETFERQIYCENLFSDRVFYVTIADADIWSLKSLHTLFDKYLDHMLVKFEQNRMVWTVQKLSFLTKNG